MLSWELLWPLGTLLLGLAIAWGMWRYHTRNKANDRVTEQATHEQYEHPKSYDNERREELEERLRPN